MTGIQKIIERCLTHMTSSTEVADALGKTGEIPLLYPVKKGQYKVGPIRCLFTANGSNYYLHDQVDQVQEGEVAVIFTQNCDNKAILGDIVCKYLLSHRRAAAVVVQGLIRDVVEIRHRNYPVWCQGSTPIGCINKATEEYPLKLRQQKMEEYDGAICVCDDTGVVAIPKSVGWEEMIARLERITLQEAIWNFCIDELGWNTKRTICDKDYFNHMNEFPKRYRDNIEILMTQFTKVEKTGLEEIWKKAAGN